MKAPIKNYLTRAVLQINLHLQRINPFSIVIVFATVVFLISEVADSPSLGKTIGTAVLTAASMPDSAAVRKDSMLVVEEHPYLFQGRIGIVDAYRLPLLSNSSLRTLDSETIWLARAIFSETKRPEEQELVAWVIRNRVETAYRGKTNYKATVLDPYQFSAFIDGSETRDFYSNLNPDSSVPGWKRALAIAYFVKTMAASRRPFSVMTRHFYSEQSMVGKDRPDWAVGFSEVTPDRNFQLNERRFRFFAKIS